MLESLLENLSSYLPCMRLILVDIFLITERDRKKVLEDNDFQRSRSEGRLLEVEEMIHAIRKNISMSISIEKVSIMGSYQSIVPQLIEDKKCDILVVSSEIGTDDLYLSKAEASEKKLHILHIHPFPEEASAV